MGTTATPARCVSSRKRLGPAAPRVTTMRSSATCASFTKSLRPVSLPHVALEGEPVAVEGRAVLGQGQRANPISPREGGKPALPLGGIGGGDEKRRRNHRALHVRARKARPPHLLDEQADVEQRAAAPAVLKRNQQPGPAQKGDLLPQLGGEPALARHAL